LERETRFRDRVRGELISPWGAADLKQIGLYDSILEGCGKALRFVDLGGGPRPVPETTPQKLPFLSFPHPEMQELVLTPLLAPVWRFAAVSKCRKCSLAIRRPYASAMAQAFIPYMRGWWWAPMAAVRKSADGPRSTQGCTQSEPKQGSVPFISTPLNEFSFEDSCTWTLN
jgi:hypothetical protein